MPPRQLRPKDDASISDSSELKSNKRRAVTSACIPCRKRKSKCDAGVPACSTCVAVYRTECSYDVDSDHRRKGALKRDLQSLQQRNDALDIIVASLRALPEQEAISLLHSLRTDTSPNTIAAFLHSSDSEQRMPDAESVQQISRTSGSSSTTSDIPFPAKRVEKDIMAQSWFSTSQDTEFIEHLLELYFSWIHPFHQLFSKEHFLFDYRNGRNDNCSAALLNAMLAFACHYSDRPAARSNPLDPSTAGDAFFTEAKARFEQIPSPVVTCVQALAVMSLRETSMGRETSGYQYAGRCVRMVIELGLHLPPTGNGQILDIELRRITVWGVFNLETMSSVGLARLSQFPRSAIDVEKPQILERIEAQLWKAYEETISNSASAAQPLRPVTFLRALSHLCENSSDMVNTFYTPKESFTSRKLAATYAQYQDWYKALPEALLLEYTALPHVIVLHMHYNACIIHLFRPYAKLDLRGANLVPRDICIQAANEISRLMNALRAMYGLRRVSVALVNILVSACTVHLSNLSSDTAPLAAANVNQAMQDLQTMSINHPWAARCLDTVRSLAVKWGMPLPEEAMVNSLRLGGSLSSPSVPSLHASSISRQQSSSSEDQSQGSSRSANESPFATSDQQLMKGSFESLLPPTILTPQAAFWPSGPGCMASMDCHFDFQHDTYPDWSTYPAQHQVNP